MDMGPCPKVHSLQLRKEYPLSQLRRLIIHTALNLQAFF